MDHILKDENRQTTSKEFTGATAENNGIRQGHVNPSDKPQFDGPDKYLGGVILIQTDKMTTKITVKDLHKH